MTKLSVQRFKYGFSLLEVLLASVITALIMAVSVNALLRGLGVNSQCLTQGTVQEQARHSVESLVRELKDSSEGCTGWAVGLNPDPVGQYYDQDVIQVSFSRCTGYDPALELRQWGPVVTFSYQPAQGAEPGKLLRTENGVQTVICDNVSDFHVHYVAQNGQFQVTVTVVRDNPQSPGHTIRASHTGTVKLRN